MVAAVALLVDYPITAHLEFLAILSVFPVGGGAYASKTAD